MIHAPEFKKASVPECRLNLAYPQLDAGVFATNSLYGETPLNSMFLFRAKDRKKEIREQSLSKPSTANYCEA